MSLHDFVCKRSEIMLQCQLHSAQNHYLSPHLKWTTTTTLQSSIQVHVPKPPKVENTLHKASSATVYLVNMPLYIYILYIVNFANWSNVGQFQKRALDLSCFLSNLSTSELRFNLTAEKLHKLYMVVEIPLTSSNHSDPTCLKRQPSNICNMQLF